MNIVVISGSCGGSEIGGCWCFFVAADDLSWHKANSDAIGADKKSWRLDNLVGFMPKEKRRRG
ncbi:hypothetical protein [Agrobacterium sp. ST15.13.015]|uniref:hypothetical protein n=1 Tax=Agrobacterium sp. ST15.13.015 TaxID=3017319 RepID=UPI0022C1B297|nr:hypothetical protein [Agrobacterium sp. ST15.13.015]MCZ7502001.1 hypothetical protein [Rhizobium rhizogenes]